MAVCTGSARLVPAERAEVLAILSEDSDEVIRERADNALISQPLDSFVTALKGDAPAAQLFRYCGRHLIEKPEIATALAKHWRCPPEFVVAAAKQLPTSGVQELMEDLDKLSASPALVSALLRSTSLTVHQREMLNELQREKAEAEDAFIEAAKSEMDPARRISLLQRLSRMRVVERVQLALKGNREERMALIRDPCKVVQRAVLQSPRITDREIEDFSAMANLSGEVLRLIAQNRNYCSNYTVVRGLITNPKTPLDVSLHLLPNITAQDLKALALNKNVPDTLRIAARRLQLQRTQNRGG